MDKNGQIDTFMALRQYLKDDAARRKTVANAVKGAPAEIREQFMAAAENTLSIFAKGGYLALDEFVTTNIPKEQQEKMQGYFYEMLYGVMNAALEDTISTYNLPAWPQDEKRNRSCCTQWDCLHRFDRISCADAAATGKFYRSALFRPADDPFAGRILGVFGFGIAGVGYGVYVLYS